MQITVRLGTGLLQGVFQQSCCSKIAWDTLVGDCRPFHSLSSYFQFLVAWVWMVGPSALVCFGFLSLKRERPGAQLVFSLFNETECSPF